MKATGPLLLARYLALAWLGVVIYASLHPFSGWRDFGVSPLAYLSAGWPRYWTAFDLVVNVIGYLPLGFLLTLALSALPGPLTAAVHATAPAAAVTLSNETLHVLLPTRVPSNVDLACNSLGGLLGAVLGHIAGPRFFARVGAWQHRLIVPRPHAELGLTLLALWLFIPVSPEILLFGAGDFRPILDLPVALPFTVGSFPKVETAVVACNAIAVGMLVRLLAASTGLAYLLVPCFLALGLLVRTLAAAVLVDAHQAFAWWTPGVQTGLLIGLGALLPLILMPRWIGVMIAALALMSGTALVNIAPANPYSLVALAVWRQGHFLNFNGLTRVISISWPFMTLPYLIFSSRWIGMR
ncbi:MAG: VanZ family protein [Betaproteobacteria bacterium]